jgi:RNA polymerase sigma-54 factor
MVGPRAQLSLRQELKMAPQLQQAFRLLQLNRLQLVEHLREVVEANPLLERTDSNTDSNNSESTPDYDDYSDLGNDSWENAGFNVSDGEFHEGADPDQDSLVNHLLWQLNLEALSDELEAIGKAIIFALDDDGYLHDDLDSIRMALAPEYLVSVDQVAQILRLIQRFEPAGVAAQDLGECLGLQLAQSREAPIVVDRAYTIVTEQLDLLARQDWQRLEKKLACTPEQREQAVVLIRSLNPRPGSSFSSDRTDYIVPDVYARPQGRGWTVQLSPENQPNLRLNQQYVGLVSKARGEDAKYLQARLQEARWLMNALELRNQTLLKVSESIIRHQQDFLHDGDRALRPMVMREVAGEVGVHESTVSRAVASKYIHTPQGIFPLRYFFSSRLDSADGHGISARAVQARIRHLVSCEDPTKPLSDEKLSSKLRDAGYRVARRTVAKYRTLLQIPDSRQRKRVVR